MDKIKTSQPSHSANLSEGLLDSKSIPLSCESNPSNQVPSSSFNRMRINRLEPSRRVLIQENHLRVSQFIVPMFVCEGEGKDTPLPTMPLIHIYSLDVAVEVAKEWQKLGIQSLLLFSTIDAQLKDAGGSQSIHPDGLLVRAIRAIKQACPELCIMSDVALDPFTSHGHDGIVSSEGKILNDATVETLAQMSLLHAQAGADYIAPSDSMDGRIQAIRQRLDDNGYAYTGIMAYGAKYASAFYGPFRDCLDSRPRFGDKKSYQLPIANRREAILEALQDEKEGADILLVKPASHCLDVIMDLRQRTFLPLAAYHVSGEIGALYAAAKANVIHFEQALLEQLLSIRRAGADIIISYGVIHLIEKGLL